MTQAEAAEALDMADKTYQRIERGADNLTLGRLERIANAFDISAITFFVPLASDGDVERRGGRPPKKRSR